MGYNLASFKNSRNYPRPATTSAVTSDATVNANTAPAPSLIIPLNPNLTYATLYNRHATDSFKYYYQAAGATPPSVATVLAEGFEIVAGAAIDLESPQAVWAVSTTANPIPIDIDEGSG
jgi:hypothetical protein